MISCDSGYLDQKREKRQVVASSIADFQALLDNTAVFPLNSEVILNIIGAEEFEVDMDSWNLLNTATEKNGYIWNREIYEGEFVLDWNRAYKGILYANTVLDGCGKLVPESNEIQDYNRVMGSAHFIRGYKLYRLLQTFAVPYNKETAATDLGVPLKLTVDIKSKSKRSSVLECYKSLLSDMEKAAELLPDKDPIKFRPDKSSAYAMLAKIHLHMEDFQNAYEYANKCLSLSSGLLDYNELDPSLRYVFSNYRNGENNPEVILMGGIGPLPVMRHPRARISKEFMDTYEEHDLRKSLFFHVTNTEVSFKGSYTGTLILFTGIGLDEIILIRSESSLRLGKIPQALQDLNELKSKRYDKRYFLAFHSTEPEVILDEIISERRKQLLYRGLRWEDLRRYNKYPGTATVLRRNLGHLEYTLEPGSPRYVWPIPEDVLGISGMPPNPR